MSPTSSFSTLLLDIEGTVTSISFVKDVLFPYAAAHFDEFLKKNAEESKVKLQIDSIRQLSVEEAEKDEEVRILDENSNLDDVLYNIRHWMKLDKKVTPLKALQGYIWQEAYENKEVFGHVYDEVAEVLKTLKEKYNKNISIYSSGSVEAQQLLFKHTISGDLTPLLSNYFDTNVGQKRESGSYVNICQQLGQNPEDVLFLTDIEQEASAAVEAGLQAYLVVREGNGSLSEDAKKNFTIIHSLRELL